MKYYIIPALLLALALAPVPIQKLTLTLLARRKPTSSNLHNKGKLDLLVYLRLPSFPSQPWRFANKKGPFLSPNILKITDYFLPVN